MALNSSDLRTEARRADAADPLKKFRQGFHFPRRRDGRPVVYLCGNSLGLMPKAAGAAVEEELRAWARQGVGGHFKPKDPWFSYHETCRAGLARLAGAKPGEVVAMNSLTVNLQLMLASFYQPTGRRFGILIEKGAFPSDLYAVESHIRQRGLDPTLAMRTVRPRSGEDVLRMEDLEGVIDREGKSIALVLLAGVQYYTGQVLDMARLARAARRRGCVVGLDLAHAIGNVELRLHDWDVDFAVWCSYKYLNAGPGAVGGCFVHERHGRDLTRPRLAGWWGNDPKTRFQMPEAFIPKPGADGWQVSNPPILAMAPLKASLTIFDEAGMEALRRKSVALTDFMKRCIDRLGHRHLEVITPNEPQGRGCQLSILVRTSARRIHRALEDEGMISDLRAPQVLRASPVPLYNTFADAWEFAQALGRLAR